MMPGAHTVFLLLLSSCFYRSTALSSVEHHTRHSTPKYFTPCPTSCECTITDHYAEKKDITCQNRSSIDLELPPAITSLIYVNVTTPTLQESNLVPTSSSGSDMVMIVIRKSGIKDFGPQTFTKITDLDHLDLSENELTEIPPTAFLTLVRLTVLNLCENKLDRLPKDLLRSQQHLTNLYLARNKFESLSTDTYYNCSVLKILDLSFNKISTITENERLNPSLEALLINNNKLRNISLTAFAGLSRLKILNLGNNEIHNFPENLFLKLNRLEKLDLENNKIASLSKDCFKGLTNLQVLNISKNPLSALNDNLFKDNLYLTTLMLGETQISAIGANLLGRLKRLKVFNASHNYHLATIEDFKFSSINRLQYIDLSFCNLTVLPIFISHLEVVEQLKLEFNSLKCDCKSGWFVNWMKNHEHALDTTLKCDRAETMIEKLKSLKCEPPEAVNNTYNEVFELRSTVVLTCDFLGEPAPSITWVTPSGYVFHYYPAENQSDIYSSHPKSHLYNLEPTEETRIKVLKNGSLQINELHRQDAGLYTCLAINPVGNDTMHIVVTLDRETFYHIKIMCIISGASLAAAVIVLTGIGNFIYWICKKCGFVEERSKQLLQLRDSIENYKSQQLKSLRENYTQQVHKIKENCAQQVEWIRDSYQGQVKNLKDFKHYGSHQFSSMRDQYYDQIRKVRDYSTTQLGWVRENYVFQRNRVQKFSSHQVLRFRESYKYQQQTLNKILGNLPSLHIDNCRGSSSGRSESSVCEGKEEMDLQGIETYVQSKLEEMTNPSILDERFDEQSVYYTPSELSESPLSPVKQLFRKHHQHYIVSPEAYSLDRPGPSGVSWVQDSPCRVFQCSQAGLQHPSSDDEFYSPRLLQSSTSLPEMPQLIDNERNNALVVAPCSSLETAL